MGYQKKRIDLLISENIILTLFTALVAGYWSFSQKNTDFFVSTRIGLWGTKRSVLIH